jgi:hypothetical protein
MMRISMMTSKKMMVKMTRMMRMRKKPLKASLKANPNNKTTSPKETSQSPSADKLNNKEESPSVETKKVTKVANPTSITTMVETETLTREDSKVASLTSITTMVETETTSTTIEEEAMVESLLSIKVATGRIIREETKTGKIIKEESLSTKETDSHSFIATN